MNHSTSADAYVPSALSFVAMDGGSSTDNQKHHQLWDWEYNSQPTANTIAAAAPANNPNNPYLVTAAGPYMDCQSSLLPVANFPFYTPMLPDYHHHHHQPIGLIKVEEEGGDMAAAGQIGLNLGHRTYFPSGDSLAIDRLFRRSRAMYQLTQQVPRCQAEGCKADLSGAKHYHRRHKVCEFHSKATVVVAGGLQQRFCQQCSRFHVLSEFDEAKRSCRRRLADHNRRRRKPQPSPSNPTPDPAAPNNSDGENKHISTREQNGGQIGAAAGSAGTAFTATTGAVGTFSSASSMSTDGHKDHNQGNNSKVALFSGGPALSLGGADEVQGGVDLGLHHSSSHRHYHHHGRPFGVVMSSDEESPHYHMPSSSSSASFYHSHHHHHNFFCSNTSSMGASQSGNGSSSDQQASHQSNQLPHLGQGLFEVDFM